MSFDLRFDQYRVVSKGGEWEVAKLVDDVPLTIAQIIAGVDIADFEESVFYEGWVGTCPQWTGYLPVVTVPSGDRLALDQLGFMLESVSKVE